MIYAKKLRTKEGIQELLEYRFPELKGTEIDPLDTYPGFGCLGCICDSSGPLIWLQNRLMEKGEYYQATGQDNQLIERTLFEDGKEEATLSRSAFWSRMEIEFICPIDLTASRIMRSPVFVHHPGELT